MKITNTKYEIPSKFQIRITNDQNHRHRPFEILLLVIVICLGFDIWDLGFGNSFCQAELQDGPASPKMSSRDGQLERLLWKDNVSPPDQSHESRKTEELKQIIEQIRSMQFEPQQITQLSPDTTPAEEPQPNTDASTSEHARPGAARRNRAETAEEKIIESSANSAVSAINNDKSISNQTLHKIEDLLKDPNTITNPLELAEVLFQSGRPGLAGPCYKQALASIASEDPNMAGERAWILFQIGNCLKYDDPNASKESYAELIRTQPNSPWSEIAKSRHGLIEWYQQDQPRKLIEELGR